MTVPPYTLADYVAYAETVLTTFEAGYTSLESALENLSEAITYVVCECDDCLAPRIEAGDALLDSGVTF